MAKIMLVEDDNNLREIYEARLLAEGYEIVSAADGEEALAIAVKEMPDLIIADVMMPKVSGFDMLDILRTTPETKDVKVIMMTALSQAEDKGRADKLGADRYLVKSQVTLEDVAKVAREVLTGESAPAAPPTAIPVSTPTDDTPAEPVISMPATTPAPAEQPSPDGATNDASAEASKVANEVNEILTAPDISESDTGAAAPSATPDHGKTLEPISTQPAAEAAPVAETPAAEPAPTPEPTPSTEESTPAPQPGNVIQPNQDATQNSL